MKEKGEKNSFPSTLVLLAALNEEKGLYCTLMELKQYLNNPRFVVVDGNSSDQTVRVAKVFGADVFCQEGEGKGDAIACALQNVSGDFDYVVIIDADYTYPARYIPEMIKKLEADPQLGMVCGNRFNSHFHAEWASNLFYIGNRMLALTHNLLNGVDLRDPLSGLRVLRWQILKNWKPRSKGFDIEAEMNYYVERKGYGIEEVDIEYRPRIGEKKLKLRHGFQILKRMIVDVDLLP
ncbi:MAG: glycosyltransferase family 2 protein [Candidatus Bathyarchaeota archaeon]|nr:glycosyltransferase family 2 protein [Candidatus Bathyarchaeota archaeon]